MLQCRCHVLVGLFQLLYMLDLHYFTLYCVSLNRILWRKTPENNTLIGCIYCNVRIRDDNNSKSRDKIVASVHYDELTLLIVGKLVFQHLYKVFPRIIIQY